VIGVFVPPSDVSEAREGGVEEVRGEGAHHAAEEHLHAKTPTMFSKKGKIKE